MTYPNNRPALIAAALLVALAQIGFLAWTIHARASLLREGREVVLAVEPVDPRDLLRGDYVILSYAISRIPVTLLAGDLPPEGEPVGALTVRLREGLDGVWSAVSAFAGSAPTPPAPDEVDVRGHTETPWRWDIGTLQVRYGIERFYLPEGEGRPIERDLGIRPFRMHVAVAESGQAQIKSFRDGDTLIYLEPLY
jgi:uncharacterized membrane-anchored protein